MYDSRKEANRAGELELLQRAGQIDKWEPQVRFPIFVNGEKICDYIADFVVYPHNGRMVVEDVKSEATKTAVYRLKKKLMKACHGIDITEL